MAEPDFEECWLDFLERSDQNEVAISCLEEQKDALGLTTAKSLLSVGPGLYCL